MPDHAPPSDRDPRAPEPDPDPAHSLREALAEYYYKGPPKAPKNSPAELLARHLRDLGGD